MAVAAAVATVSVAFASAAVGGVAPDAGAGAALDERGRSNAAPFGGTGMRKNGDASSRHYCDSDATGFSSS
jgi:hypothetical protein